MAKILQSYAFVLLPSFGAPLALYLIGPMFGEPVAGMSMFKLGLLLTAYILATQGLSNYFPRENLATRSIGTLIEQHVLMGLLFAAFMTLGYDYLPSDQPRSDWQTMRSFVMMAVFFGGLMFVTALFHRRQLLRKSADQA